ncbi:unnamed protein product, partial [Rotaria sp. Silwood1]
SNDVTIEKPTSTTKSPLDF